ncbi:MAG: tetratricopeptide repeat protein, partial [Streptomyces sp.]|uniref:tetratricopeptide repeat protein n=1 Tax=Streptomyces sp. TaxID=1931 RepID=UPI003D6AB627
YIWESEHDIDRALASARRVITALTPVDNPFLQVMGHARLSELCLQTERGEEAYGHLKSALEVLPRLGDEQDSIGVRWGLVLACLQRGDPDEAEYWLRQAEGGNTPRKDDFYSPDFGGRAEIALARGLTEVGLGLWRRNMERIPEADSTNSDDPFFDRWVLQIQSAAVTAHAHAGRLGLVAEVVDRLRQRLRTLLSGPSASPMELPVFGTGLHALGMAGLVSGDARAVRMIALAERLRVLRDFQPTMSADRARQAVGAAGNAARAAYADAVSEYAALGRDELREAARAVMSVTSGRG